MSGDRSAAKNSDRRERLRLEHTSHEVAPNGMVRVRVGLEWRGQAREAQAEGVETREGVLRLGAEATVQVVADLVPEGPPIELLGVKATKAFGTWVAMAYLRVGQADDRLELLGARAIEGDDLVRGGAVAVLDALNRVLSNQLAASD